jgi:G3E family GTPase
VRNDLVDTLRDLYIKRVKGEVPEFRRVVIETTGLADPAPILHTLMTDPLISSRFRLDGVVSTVDAYNGGNTLDRQPESVKQAAVADRIVLSKVDITEPAVTARLRDRLRTINPAAPILEVVNGAIGPERLFDAGLYDPATKSADARAWLNAEAYAAPAAHAHHHDHHHHDHDCDEACGHHHHHHDDANRHDDRIRAFALTFDEPFVWEQFATWMDLLASYRGDDLLRVKGLIAVEGVDRPVVIHGVQHVFHPPASLPAWPDDDHRSRIVFITRDIPQRAIEQTYQAMIDAVREAKAAESGQ